MKGIGRIAKVRRNRYWVEIRARRAGKKIFKVNGLMPRAIAPP